MNQVNQNQMMIDLYTSLLNELEEVKHLEVMTAFDLCGSQFFEVRMKDEKRGFKGMVNIPLTLMKEKKVTATLKDGYRVQAWLDTTDGFNTAIEIKRIDYKKLMSKYKKKVVEV
ncbi:hypothetical protein [Priestia aryabhattai]|uniref:hypothetical protein n=1 Tax=Priestia aryabhattai TaxID=412384 RepID=UPI003CB98546